MAMGFRLRDVDRRHPESGDAGACVAPEAPPWPIHRPTGALLGGARPPVDARRSCAHRLFSRGYAREGGSLPRAGVGLLRLRGPRPPPRFGGYGFTRSKRSSAACATPSGAPSTPATGRCSATSSARGLLRRHAGPAGTALLHGPEIERAEQVRTEACIAEALAGEARAGLAHAPALLRVGEQRGHRVADRGAVAVGDEQAGLAVGDD